VESIITRWRKAVARVPEPGTPDAAVLAQKRKQRRLIQRTIGVVVVLAAGGYAYSFLAGAPERARAEMALGIQKMGPGTYDEAIRHFDRAIGVWPELAEAYLNRAVAEHDVSQRGPALIDLDKALDLNPNLTRAYNERGQIYLENGEPKKAISEFDKSIRVNPTLEGYYQRGQAYEALGEHQKAIADYDAAISEFREAPYTYRARANARRNAGDCDGADADEQAALRIEGDVHR
jgi:tetratricopeptide (TPR) repeat protein